MANANITIDEGTGKKTSAYSHSEDSETKYLQRHTLNNSSGTEIATQSNPIRVDPTGTTTQPVSAASLPLPSGAATAANQAVEQTLIGAVNETAPATDTASSGLNGRLQRIAQRLTSILAATFGFSVGSGTTDATTLRVVTASDGALNTNVGGVTETAPATDTASSGLNGRLQRIAQRITSLIALLPASIGQKAKAAALAVTLSSDEDLLTNVGGVTETAPATDTASSGLNGRLQRIAQRLTSLIAVFTTGSGTSTAAIRVELPTNGTGVISGVTTVTTVSTVSTLTGGGVAHDAADSGNPIKIGAKAETSPKGITPVADGDRTDLYADADGQLIVKQGTSNADVLTDATSNTDGNSTASGVFTAVASTYNNITGFQIFRTDSGTTPIYIDFRNGTGGSVLWRAVIPAGGGSNSPFYVGPFLFRTSANTALAYDVSAATTTVYINVHGYQSKV